MGTRDAVTFRKPDDWHAHFRQERFLALMVEIMRRQFARAIAMCNIKPPASDADTGHAYKSQILAESGPGFEPILALKLLDRLTQRDMEESFDAGFGVFKGYPRGGTSHAEDGLLYYEMQRYYPQFEVIQDRGGVLELHGEVSGEHDYIMDREFLFLRILEQVVRDFPRLKVVLEHITTAAAVHMVRRLPDTVAATITLQHLELTTNDVLAGKLRPHNFCMPVAKRFEDRAALRAAAISGNPKFFFGSDTAVWGVDDKECAEGCAGVFSGPVLVPRLFQVFDEMRARHRFGPFVSEFGARFYGRPLNEGTLTLVPEPWIVPARYGDARPYLAGETLPWRIKE